MTSIRASISDIAQKDLASLRGKSLLIFDDGMVSKDGHWFEYNRALVEAHRDLGVRTTIICNAKCKEVAELEAVGARVLPLVTRSVWTGDGAKINGPFSELLHIVSLGAHFAAILRSHFKHHQYDCVFLPNARIHDAFAWCLLGTRAYKQRWCRLALLFRFGVGRIVDSGSPIFARKLFIWRYLLGFIARSNRDKVHFLTDSSRLASEYKSVAHVDLNVMPSPRSMKPTFVKMPIGSDFLFATLGAARIEKGVETFQKAVRKLIESESAEGMQFLIQWNRDVLTADGKLYPRDPVLVASDRVEYIDSPLSSEEYDEVFGQIGCMVLPYRRSMYHSQISGVAIEAACAGIPIIYTQDTWLADFVEDQGAGIGVRDGDVDSLVEAIRTITTNRDQYLEEARAYSFEARRRNSAEAFVHQLWGLSGPLGREKRP